MKEKFANGILDVFDKYTIEALSILLMFIPGVMYQVKYLGANISDYNGFSIILFLIVSLYYSLFFILGCTFIFMTLPNREDFENKFGFLMVSCWSIMVFFFASITNLSAQTFWIIAGITMVLIAIISFVAKAVGRRIIKLKNRNK